MDVTRRASVCHSGLAGDVHRRPGVARPIALVILLALPWTATGPVHAQEPAPADWRAPAECPDRAQVVEAVDRLLGRPVAPEDGVALRGEVVAIDGGGFELTLGDASAPRVLRADSCEVLAEAAALLVAMAIDPDAVAQAAPPEPRPAAAQAEAPVEDARPLAAALDVPRPGEPEPHRKAERVLADRTAEGAPSSAGALRIHAATGVGMDAGTLPGVALALQLVAGLSIHRTRVELVGTYLPSRVARADNHATARGAVSLLALGLRSCVAAVDGAVALGPCGGLEIGAMTAAGEGVSTPGASTVPWASASAGAFVTVPLAGWLALRADAAGVLAVTRPSFVIEGVDGTVHRPGAVAARLAVGAEARFR